MVLSGFSDPLEQQHLVAAASGQFPQELRNFRFKCGDLVVTVMDSVHVTVVITIVVLVADSIMSKPSTYNRVGSIPFVPLAFTAAAQESVLVAMDVLHMSMDVI
tara:strand:- start:957 stop:1268 length:312 start_codon:yes stop_codon:yes gene_type:complete